MSQCIALSKPVKTTAQELTPPRLIRGDCIDEMSALEGCVDLVVTSPPYPNYGMAYGDAFATIADYLDFSRRWMERAAKALRPGGAMWINVGMLKAGRNSRVPLTYYLFPILSEVGLDMVQEVVWDRRVHRNTKQRFATVSERWLYVVKPGAKPVFNVDDVRRPSLRFDRRNNPSGTNPADIWSFVQVHGVARERTAHPCQFPQAMIERIVLACSNPGDVVLDPFAGSGTTGAAALAKGRSAIMIERKAEYWPIIEERLGIESPARLILGDTLAEMAKLPDESIDLIAADLPYGCTRQPWDEVIPMDALWAEYRRILKPSGTIVLTSAGMFTAKLTMAADDLFKYDLVWEKTRATGFVHAKFRVLTAHEDVLVFSKGGIGRRASRPMTYNPQGVIELPEPRVSRQSRGSSLYHQRAYTFDRRQTHTNYPRSVLRFPVARGNVHPTQKPVALFDWIIRTYSNTGDVVLDNTMGSGTTGVAAVAAGRRFIGIERDPKFFELAEARVREVIRPEKPKKPRPTENPARKPEKPQKPVKPLPYITPKPPEPPKKPGSSIFRLAMRRPLPRARRLVRQPPRTNPLPTGRSVRDRREGSLAGHGRADARGGMSQLQIHLRTRQRPPESMVQRHRSGP